MKNSERAKQHPDTSVFPFTPPLLPWCGWALLGCLALLVAAPMARAQANSFTTTGSLATARRNLTATLLPNGQVLVAAGADANFNPLASAEVYDPAAGNWTATGSLTTARSFYTATLLPEGKVLVAGGAADANFDSLASAELYDPATGSWTATGSLATARYGHTETLLPNGRVLVAGGYDTAGNALASAELYDPATGNWTATGSLNAGRSNLTATLLPDGQVLVAGGSDTNSDALTNAELYDPATGSWAATGSLATARNFHTATLLPNGQVLVSGGSDTNGDALTNAELYDPATGSWTATGSLATARFLHTATLLPNGQVLVAGGRDSGNNALTSAELFNPANGSWAATGSLATGRRDHTATMLPNGQVLVAAGEISGGPVLASAELYDSASGSWGGTGSLAAARQGHTATLLPDGQVLAAGGFGTSTLASAELYEPASGSWAATGSLATARNFHTATLLPNGQVLVAAGINSGTDLASAELYDPASGTWSATGSLAAARRRHTAALLPNGKVLVAGGANVTGFLANAELYDPATGSWTTTGGLTTARSVFTATLLPNGQVLVAGGSNGNALASAEIYDPTSGTWTATGNLGTARFQHTATLLPSGFVLVAGGFNSGGALASAELYDPATGSWTATGSLAAARYVHTATLLPDGQVLAAGGINTGALTSAELYDPATGSWTATGSLAAARYVHTATLLSGGQVLAAGGFNTSALASAELYDVGLGFSPSAQPRITAASFNAAGQLVLDGTGFAGLSGGSGGNTQESPTNYPVVQLRYLDNEQTLFLPYDPASSASATAFTSAAGVFPRRHYILVTVFANGIPSPAVLVDSAPHYFLSGRTAPRGGLALPVLVGLPDQSNLSVTAVGRPQFGTAIISPDGKSILYKPGVTFATLGSDDTFTYTVTDSVTQLSSTYTLTIGNPAYPEKGVYDALVSNETGAVGYLELALTGTGALTGTLRLGTTTAPLKGQIGLDGQATLLAPGGVDVVLSLGVAKGTLEAQVGKSRTLLSSATLLGSATLTRSSYYQASNNAPQSGSYTVLLPAPSEPNGITATAAATVVAGKITQLTLNPPSNGGSGYLAPPAVYITSPTGSGAVFMATLASGAVTGFTAVSEGKGYPGTGVTVTIDPPSDYLPAGPGKGLLTVAPSGLVKLAGELGDGTPCSASGLVKDDGTVALYAALPYKPGPAGSLSGTLTFRDAAQTSDADGPLTWVKPPQTGASRYRSGFTAQIAAIASRYVPPAPGQQALVFTNPTLGMAALTLQGGDLVAAQDDAVSVNSANVVHETSLPLDKLKLAINPANGLFMGSFTGGFAIGGAPAKLLPAKFLGVLFQKQNRAEGLYLEGNHSGTVSLTPQ